MNLVVANDRKSIDEIKELFLAWKQAEGFNIHLAEGFYGEHYSHASRRTSGEWVKAETMASERYSDFHKKNSVIYNLIIDEYLKNTTMNDDWHNEKLRERILTLSAPTHFFDGIRIYMELLLESKELAKNGSYISASILLRSIIEGIIKTALKLRVRVDNRHKMSRELDSFGTPKFEKKWSEVEFIGSKKERIDTLGLAKLCKYADEYKLTYPVSNLYREFKLNKLNDYSHLNARVLKENWTNPILHLQYNSENWDNFAEYFLVAKEILLLVTHSFAKTLEWFDASGLNFNYDKIRHHIPRYAEALIPEGLITKCISCGKKLTNDVLKHRGRCYTCYCEIVN